MKINEIITEAKKANTKTARAAFGKRTSSKTKLSDREQEKKKADSDDAWARLMAYIEAEKKNEGISENMDHSKDGRAVEELRAALENKRSQLQSADSDEVYDIIDEIMTRIAKSHSISGQKLHDMWVDKYREVPDTWVMEI
jgi:hypothetical protein